MPWWVGRQPGAGDTIGQDPTRAQFARDNAMPIADVHGPFATETLAFKWEDAHSGGGGGTKPPPQPKPCKGSGNWFFNTVSGSLNRVPSGIAQLPYRTALGWNKLNISYCATRDQAIAEAQKEFPGEVPGQSLGSNLAQDTGLSPLQGIGDFFGRLTEPSTWIRVGEVAIGVIALGIGLYVLVKDSKAGKAATGSAKTAAMAAVPELAAFKAASVGKKARSGASKLRRAKPE